MKRNALNAFWALVALVSYCLASSLEFQWEQEKADYLEVSR